MTPTAQLEAARAQADALAAITAEAELAALVAVLQDSRALGDHLSVVHGPSIRQAFLEGKYAPEMRQSAEPEASYQLGKSGKLVTPTKPEGG